MKELRFKLLVLLGAGMMVFSCNDSMVTEDFPDEDFGLKSASIEKQSYIVVLNDSDLNSELSRLKGYEKKQEKVRSKSLKILERAGIIDGDIGYVYGNSIKGFSIMIPPGQLKKLQDDPSVKYIEKDKIEVFINPLRGKPNKGGGGGGGTPPPQETPWGIVRVNGGESSNGVAWILDSGIDLDHPDLNVDGARSVSFLSGKQADNPDDQNGHGTHVAGTIGAIDNTEGVIGVAAGATLISVRVLDRRGSGSYSGVIAGIDYVGANGNLGDVANMSLGGSFSQAINDAVQAASDDVKFVLAAGNESTDANNRSPASADGPNIYTVSAMSQGDNWASFSNFGNPPVDYCAPGVGIKSTWKDGGYNTINGTSMAAPHVAGIILLGSVNTDGTVNGDPDGNPDPIAHR